MTLYLSSRDDRFHAIVAHGIFSSYADITLTGAWNYNSITCYELWVDPQW